LVTFGFFTWVRTVHTPLFAANEHLNPRTLSFNYVSTKRNDQRLDAQKTDIAECWLFKNSFKRLWCFVFMIAFLASTPDACNHLLQASGVFLVLVQ